MVEVDGIEFLLVEVEIAVGGLGRRCPLLM
jgi:hypothetical protein